ncbi:glycosyltransferase [Shewanella waksmanii]|uniref:glycosyltransferase n=1 Tax=Shewanella waksmanii TaxID=213783 RepID=UPI003736F987
MKSISVCIPVFNPNMTYLQLAVESVLAQYIDNWELVLVEGSGSRNQDIEKFVDSFVDHRIKYVMNEEDTTMAGNWNFCIESAKFDLVTLLHDDDYLLPNYLKQVIELHSQYPEAAACFTSATTVDEQGRPCLTMADRVKGYLKPRTEVIVLKEDNGLSSILSANYIFCPTLCYNKVNLGNIRFEQRWNMVADIALYAELLVQGKCLVGSNKEHYIYRRHSNNQTAKLTLSTERFEEEVALYNTVNSSLLINNWPLTIKVTRSKNIIKLHIVYCLLVAIVKLDKHYAKKLIKIFFKCFR